MLRQIIVLSDFSLPGQPEFKEGEEKFMDETLALTLEDRGLVEVLPIPPKPPINTKESKSDK